MLSHCFCLALSLASADPTWKKVVVDPRFRSEGVAVADVNGDGRLDILVGDLWYEAPDWTPHEIRPVGDYGDGSKGYSECMVAAVGDFNGDGRPDQLVIGFPGKSAYWYENPGRASGHWRQHEIWPSACNESPQFVDLLGDGRPVLVMGVQPAGQQRLGQMAWFRPGPDPTQHWVMHPISEPSTPQREIPGTFRFYHGLGVGDVNGDGRNDVITRAGLWEQPPDAATRTEPWPFHPAELGDDCADMVVTDIDGDGRPDIVTSSAHRYGVWAFLQRPGSDGRPSFLKQDLFPKLVSQTHALILADIDGDGQKDLVTGKRFWAHGPKGDVGADEPVKLYWFKATRSGEGLTRLEPKEIDGDSGIGTQFVVIDLDGNGKPDIVTASKRGVFIHYQQ